jgi:hypothetical protein
MAISGTSDCPENESKMQQIFVLRSDIRKSIKLQLPSLHGQALQGN